jgi:hypothetical protein
MNMTQIAPTTRAEINERLRDAIQRPIQYAREGFGFLVK